MIKKFIALAVLCLSALAAHAEVINIDSAELARLAARGVPVIDIRTEGEAKDSGVIAGSTLLTFLDEKGNANPPHWLEQVKGVAKPDQPVILVCRSGKRSQTASQLLAEQAGYQTVYNVSKGLNAWIGEGRPLVPAVSPK